MANMARVKVKLDLKKLKQKVIKPTKKFEREARRRAKRIFKKQKEILLEEFRSHPITKELQAGPYGGNSSGTLGGIGNLFSFIGFDAGADPTAVVEEGLRNFITLDHSGSPKGRGRSLRYEFRVKGLSLEEFEKFTPMPWEGGRSWLRGIERGISGFGEYMYGRKYANNSRSGSGVQSRRTVRGGGFRNVPYMSQIFNNFKKNLSKTSKK